MGGAKALIPFNGAPQRPGSIYTAKARDIKPQKNLGTDVQD